MKFISVGALVSVALVMPGYQIDPYIEETPTNLPTISTETYYGPFDGTKNIEVRFKPNEMLKNTEIKFEYSYNSNGNVYAIQTHYLEDIVGDDGYFTKNFILQNRMGFNGVNVKVTVYNTKWNLERSFDIPIYTTISETINSVLYRNNPYTISNRVFKVIDSEVYTTETLSFKNTIDYLTNDYDNSIPLNEISFYCNTELPISYEGAKIYIQDDDSSIFPFLTHTDGYVAFPIKVTKTGDEVVIDTDFTYYYSTLTLEMKRNRRKDDVYYTSTHKIYIPKNQLKKLEEATLYIEFPNFLVSGTSIHMPLQFFKDRNYIGFCSDSNHCILGGIKE